MLIEIYDYAAKLLNNMTATTATIINNLASRRAAPTPAGGKAESPNPRTTTNLTSKLLQATTGNMKALLNRTLATMGGQHSARLTTLLLHGGLGADVTAGQRIRHTPNNGHGDGDGAGHANANASINGSEPNMYNAFSETPGFIESSTTAASTVLSSAITNLPEATGPAVTFPAQTMATFIAAGNKNRAATIYIYPTGEFMDFH